MEVLSDDLNMPDLSNELQPRLRALIEECHRTRLDMPLCLIKRCQKLTDSQLPANSSTQALLYLVMLLAMGFFGWAILLGWSGSLTAMLPYYQPPPLCWLQLQPQRLQCLQPLQQFWRPPAWQLPAAVANVSRGRMIMQLQKLESSDG